MTTAGMISKYVAMKCVAVDTLFKTMKKRTHATSTSRSGSFFFSFFWTDIFLQPLVRPTLHPTRYQRNKTESINLAIDGTVYELFFLIRIRNSFNCLAGFSRSSLKSLVIFHPPPNTRYTLHTRASVNAHQNTGTTP